MTEPQSAEAARILARLRQEIDRAGSPAGSPGVGTTPPTLTLSCLDVPVGDLAPLRAEVETALSGTRDVGQINPRPPGLHNRVIQFAKKVMRRSLSWYTRPIHVFQGAVIRALQQIVALLQGQQEQAGHVARDLAVVADHVARANQASAVTREQLTHQITVTQTEVLEHVSKVSDAISREVERARTDLGQKMNQINDELSGRLIRAENVVQEQISRTNGELSDRIAGMTDQIAGIRDSSLQQVGQFKSILDGFRAQLDNERKDLLAIIRQQRLRERDIRRFIDVVERGVTSQPASPPRPTPPMFASEIKHQDQFDYFVFEEKYRGDEALVRSRQQEYLHYFRGRENVIDIGCGRGEFLELLRDNGITARGVELGNDQFLLCREKGLDVVHEDLFVFLESLPDGSIGGLFSAQVIEHLTASDQLRYVALAYRKSKPGSPVIFETINAECVFAIMRSFFLDPTHVRPVHPETLKFAMESVSFRDVELKFMSPVTDRQIPPLNIPGCADEVEKFNSAIRQLNDLIYGYQDYAAIGWH